MRLLRKFALAAVVAAFMALPGSASAVNSSSCTFENGTTTCTTAHGSHGSTSEHQGSPGSNGTSKNPPGECKVTGSDHSCG